MSHRVQLLENRVGWLMLLRTQAEAWNFLLLIVRKWNTRSHLSRNVLFALHGKTRHYENGESFHAAAECWLVASMPPGSTACKDGALPEVGATATAWASRCTGVCRRGEKGYCAQNVLCSFHSLLGIVSLCPVKSEMLQ